MDGQWSGSESSRCLRGELNANHLSPAGGSFYQQLPSSGSNPAAPNPEMVTGCTELFQRAVGVFSRLEPAHLPFSSSGGLVGHLGPVVEVGALAMLDAGQDVALCRAVAAQLVGHDHPRDALQAAQQLAEEPLGRPGIPPALYEDVEHVAVLVHARQR